MPKPLVNLKGTTLLAAPPPPLWKSILVFLRVLFGNLVRMWDGAKHEYTLSRGREQPHLAKMGLGDPIGRLRAENMARYGDEFETPEEDMPQLVLYKNEQGDLMSDALMRQVKTDERGIARLPSGKRVNLAARSTIAIEGSMAALEDHIAQTEAALLEGAEYSEQELKELEIYKRQVAVEKGEKHVV